MYTVEKISSNQVKIEFTIPAEEVNEAYRKAFAQNKNMFRVPGFRKGKAPRSIVESMYGKDVLTSDAVDVLMKDQYGKVIDDEKLAVVDAGSIQNVDMAQDQEAHITVTVYVEPEVELADYSSVEVELHLDEVTDERVQEAIDVERRKLGRKVEVTEGGIQEGDDVEFDYAGTVNGEAFEGGSAEHYTLKIGSNSFIPGFESQMVGLCVNDESDLAVTFPEKYHSEELAGKDAVFHVKIHKITREELPAEDDEFAADVSDFDTFEEYKKSVVEKLEKECAESNRQNKFNAAIGKLATESKMDIPQPMVDRELDMLVRRQTYQIQAYGISFDQYLSMMGTTQDQFRTMMRPQAEFDVKCEMVIKTLLDKPEFKASDEEVLALVAKRELNKEGKMTEDELLKNYREMASQEKLQDVMLERITVVEPKAEEPDDEAETETSDEENKD